MWTETGIRTFIKDNPIDTQGAISTYEISIEEIEDGDVYFRVTLPYWSHNASVAKGVLTLALKSLMYGDSRVYLTGDSIVLNLYVSVCNPD